MRDSTLYMKTAGMETGNTTGSATDLGKGGVVGELPWLIVITAVQGTSPTLDLVIEFSDASNFATVPEKITLAQLSAVGSVAFAFQTRYRYCRYKSTIGGSATPGLNYSIYAATGKRHVDFNIANS